MAEHSPRASKRMIQKFVKYNIQVIHVDKLLKCKNEGVNVRKEILR